MSQAEIPDASHSVVIRSATTFWRHPGDDLVGVHDVAGLAMNAVGRIQVDGLALGRVGRLNHFVDIGGTEILARISEFHYTSGIADVGVVNHQM